jgi:hypothetical protein
MKDLPLIEHGMGSEKYEYHFTIQISHHKVTLLELRIHEVVVVAIENWKQEVGAGQDRQTERVNATMKQIRRMRQEGRCNLNAE